jgi:hypothetical protein
MTGEVVRRLNPKNKAQRRERLFPKAAGVMSRSALREGVPAVLYQRPREARIASHYIRNG